MANFYAKVKTLLRDCDISYIEPLSYMKHFTTAERSESSNSEKIVLLYKNVSFEPIYWWSMIVIQYK